MSQDPSDDQTRRRASPTCRPTDHELAILCSSLTHDQIAEALGVSRDSITRWLREARARDPEIGRKNYRSEAIADALTAQTDAFRAVGPQIVDAAAQALLRGFRREFAEPKYAIEQMRVALEFFELGAGIPLPGLDAPQREQITDAIGLRDRVRAATADAVIERAARLADEAATPVRDRKKST